jgi:hypothetical protein
MSVYHKVKSTEENIKYVQERNALIPTAERHADKLCGSTGQGMSDFEREQWVAKWNRIFHGTMDNLWKKENLLPEKT